ncbi:hypothetical protein QM467_07150 [Rhodoblastus sp. 17X3]|uniref:hypothetical protein n=1 Tax=Rhodoblastus sp. 17X3 TaxID=3047026 RepID=UPI0024B6E2D6|nr:hypothetical protein [Rhodoblastus sp. 17X3]MDI9847828.1 hypothetical protein [Rhodoblastus sp. 17X3]
MNIPELSDQSLRDLHDLIQEAMKTDDQSQSVEKPYGVRSFPAWRRQADQFEAELEKRALPYEKINWG